MRTPRALVDLNSNADCSGLHNSPQDCVSFLFDEASVDGPARSDSYRSDVGVRRPQQGRMECGSGHAMVGARVVRGDRVSEVESHLAIPVGRDETTTYLCIVEVTNSMLCLLGGGVLLSGRHSTRLCEDAIKARGGAARAERWASRSLFYFTRFKHHQS